MKRKRLIVAATILCLLIAAAILLKPELTGKATTSVTLFVVGNRAPVLDPIGDQTATEGTRFTLQVSATDPDGNTLEFRDNATIFDINRTTGIINFTPTLPDVGNHSIAINASDGNASDSETITFRVSRGPYCGDGSCNSDETCLSCASDCGACPSDSTGEGTGTGTGAGTGAGAGTGTGEGAEAAAEAASEVAAMLSRAFHLCNENWKCTEWSACANGFQERKCTDSRKCGTKFNKPSEKKTCEAEQAGGPGDACSDGIKNNGEEDTDCGGPCTACVVKRFAKIPVPGEVEPFRTLKKIPWAIPIAMAILASVFTAADNVYISGVRRLEFSKYRRKASAYRAWRKRLYTGIASIIFLAAVYSGYIYYFSNDPVGMREKLWVPGLLTTIVPAAAYLALKKREYSEFGHEVAQQRLERTHQRQLWQMAKIETEALMNAEERAVNLLEKVALREEYKHLQQLKDSSRTLFDLHSQQTGSTILDIELASSINAVSSAVPALYRSYPELARMAEEAKRLSMVIEGDEGDLIEKAGNFMDSVKKVAKDKLLISEITADSASVAHYNRVIDIYQRLEQMDAKRKQTVNEATEKAKEFVQLFESAFSGNDFAESHKEDASFVSAYNSLVEIYGFYKKREES